jgi:hypothetical protein
VTVIGTSNCPSVFEQNALFHDIELIKKIPARLPSFDSLGLKIHRCLVVDFFCTLYVPVPVIFSEKVYITPL